MGVKRSELPPVLIVGNFLKTYETSKICMCINKAFKRTYLIFVTLCVSASCYGQVDTIYFDNLSLKAIGKYKEIIPAQ